MLAIGEGASVEAQNRIRRLGSRNLILTVRPPPQGESASRGTPARPRVRPPDGGCSTHRETIPHVSRVAARRNATEKVRNGPRKLNARARRRPLDLRRHRHAPPRAGPLPHPRGRGPGERRLRPRRHRGPAPLPERRSDRPSDLGGQPSPTGWSESSSNAGESGGGAQTGIDDALFVPLATMEIRYGEILAGFATGACPSSACSSTRSWWRRTVSPGSSRSPPLSARCWTAGTRETT